MKKKYIILILLFCNIAIGQTTYYVSTNGTDSNSGAVSAPFQTIQYAISQSINGDVIKVNSGIYQELLYLDGTNSSIKIESVSGPESTILSMPIGAVTLITLIDNASAVSSKFEINGFTLKNTLTSSPSKQAFEFYRTEVVVKNVIVTNFQLVILMNTSSLDVQNGVFYNNGSLITNHNAFLPNPKISISQSTIVDVSGLLINSNNSLMNYDIKNSIIVRSSQINPTYYFETIKKPLLTNVFVDMLLPTVDLNSIFTVVSNAQSINFVDLINKNFRLSNQSLAIGSGAITPDIPLLDLDGNTRPFPVDSKPDLGAYENTYATPQHNSTIYVATTGNDSDSVGLSNAPFATIQAAINYSINLDQIIVSPGTYIENLNILEKVITITTTNPNQSRTNTIIDGGLNGQPVVMIDGNGSSLNNLTSELLFSGFTLKNGLSPIYEVAGGIVVRGTHAANISIKLENLIIENNTATNAPGGSYFYYTDKIYVENVIYRNNKGVYGFGAFNAQFDMNGCQFYQNNTQTTLMDFWHNSNISTFSTIKNSLFINNTCTGTFNVMDGIILNSTITGNGSNNNFMGKSAIVNSIIGQNQLINSSSGLLNISNSLIKDGINSVTTFPNFLTFQNNLSGEIYFENEAANNYKLSNYSNCIGQGVKDITLFGVNYLLNSTSYLDLDGLSRPLPADSNPDLGAYENNLAQKLHNSTIYVAKTGSDSGSVGLSTAPFATIQAAIDYSINGDTVIVNPGKYTENIIYNGKIITITSLYFSTQNESYIASTIIDGGANGLPVVRFHNGETLDAKLIGLTVQNGFTSSNEWGAGINIENFSTVTLEHLIVQNNTSMSGVGGGIRAHDSHGLILNHLIIRNNLCNGMGGAIYTLGSVTKLSNSEIYGNTGDGSAINTHGSPNNGEPAYNCVFYNNTGGTLISANEFSFINCTFINNNGTLLLYGSSSIINSIVGPNQPINNQGSLNVYNSDIQDGKSSITSRFASLLTYMNNISEDPLYIDGANKNFRLSNYSPVIGTGINSAVAFGTTYNAPAIDIEGSPRPSPIGSNPDMGAYENSLSEAIHNRTIYVSTTGNDIGSLGFEAAPFATIQAAVNYSNSGDVILVDSGTYDQHDITINKGITIKSLNGYSNTLIQSNLQYSAIFIISAPSSETIIIEGFKLKSLLTGGGDTDGFKLSDATVSVSKCWIEKFRFATHGGSNITFTNCFFNENEFVAFQTAAVFNFCDIRNSVTIAPYNIWPIEINNSIIWNNTGKLTNYFINYAPLLNKVIIDSNPNVQVGSTFKQIGSERELFFTNSDNLDFSLKMYSPAIGYGNGYNTPTTDILENSRPNPLGSFPDVGAFENASAKPSNAPPSINALSTITIDEDTPIQTVNLSGITDGDFFASQDFTISVTSNNQSLIPNPTLTYTANEPNGFIQFTSLPNANGIATITITIKDNGGIDNGGIDTTIATFDINVNPVNDAPIANSQAVTTLEDTNIAITLTGSDIEGSTLNYSITTLPTSGVLYQTTDGITLGEPITTVPTTVSNKNKKVIYKPSLNQNGLSLGNFQFETNDGLLNSLLPATVSVDVAAVNDAPLSIPQTVTTNEDTDLVITLSGTDLENSSLSFYINTLPINGLLFQTLDGITKTDAIIATNTLVTNVDGKIIFEPVLNGNGNNYGNFNFKSNDGQLDGLSTTITINVTAVNDAPIANSQAVTTLEDTNIAITLTGSDIEGSALNYSITTLPASGVLYQTTDGITLGEPITTVPTTVSNKNKKVIYKPSLNQNGLSLGNFQFETNDGLLNSLLPATVSVDVTAFNDDPLSIPQTVSTNEDTDLVITLSGTDVENSSLSFYINTLPINGLLFQTLDGITKTDAIIATNTLVTNVDGKIIFEPVLNGNGNNYGNFNFKSNDGQLDGLSTTITVNVTAVNDAPTSINFSGKYVDENLNDQIIGNFSTTDVDLIDTYTYELVSGTGDTDNSFFTISGNQLKNNVAFDFEIKSFYSVRIKSTDSANNSIESFIALSVTNVNDIAIGSVINNTYCEGTNASGTINITVTQTNGAVSYLWTGPNGFSSTQKDLSNLSQGTYAVTITDSNYSKSQDIVIGTTPVFSGLDLCYVTSDATDFTKNRINLSYISSYNVDKFQILREGTVSGEYDVIGEVNSKETSYMDLTSVNSASSYKYKVRTKDLCGNISTESTSHKTILLQSSVATNSTVNLSWTPYEGLTYGTYVIYRKVNSGLFEVLTSVASTNLNYTDISANTTLNSYSYYVSIAVNSCTTSSLKIKQPNNKVSTASEIRSNYKIISEQIVPAFTLPSTNFTVEVKDETCITKSNGEINITAVESYPYVATINGKIYNFVNNSLAVPNQPPGSYAICITIPGKVFEQCYTVNVAKGKTITGKLRAATNKVSVEIVEGTAPYQIFVNGKEQFETESTTFSVDVKKGDLLEVKTAKSCEGIYSKGIGDLLGVITLYPNPTSGSFEINLPTSRKEVVIDLYTAASQLISKRTYPVENERVQLNLANEPSGVYIVKIYLDTPENLTIIKN